jgi:two-component system, chemotaxis family, chemotaxis protein CheY
MDIFGQKKRVVLVDDDPIMRAVIRSAINSLHCQVVGEGVSGEEAIQLFRQHRPDLMLLDVTMEKMTGTEALKVIKAEFPDALIIMLTASGDAETVSQCIRAGAARYVLKDTSAARIRVIVVEALGLAS